MSLNSISLWLLENVEFQRQLNRIAAKSVVRGLGGGVKPSPQVESREVDWSYMIYCASILAYSNDARAEEAALQIVQFALTSIELGDGIKTAAAVILNSMSNKPAIDLAIKRQLIASNFDDHVPIPLKLDEMRATIESRITRNDDQIFYGNKFQRKFWSVASNNDWVSVSAPTSSGKSYVLIQWIGEHIREGGGKLVIYIVPTRALISQVFSDLREFFSNGRLVSEVNLSSFPDASEIKVGKSNIFVFTQERLHAFLLSMQKSGGITAVIVDEAHKVGDKYRGVLLQQMINWIYDDEPGAKFIFSSPFAQNPEYLLEDAPQGSLKRAFVDSTVTVNQNLLWVSQAERSLKIWNVDLCRGGGRVEIGRVALRESPNSKRKRLAYLAVTLSNGQPGNIIYVNGAEEAEIVAELVANKSSYSPQNPDISNLIDICKKSVHVQFKLARLLEKGVAFHYGNIPQIVRLEVERLFKKDLIHTLVCTSTLIEGVNLSCRNIFLRGPQKGRGNHMPNEDFWNLAGRAGRWGREFQGNVFCIDPKDQHAWGASTAPKERKQYYIRRTTDKILSESEDLLSYILGSSKGGARDRDKEYVFSYMLSAHYKLGGIRRAGWLNKYNSRAMEELFQEIEKVAERMQLPPSVFDRNPGINPLAIDRLFKFFVSQRESLSSFAPLDPREREAVESYSKVFRIIGEVLEVREFQGAERKQLAIAILVHQWMSGMPIPVIISKKWKNSVARGRKSSISTIIRTVLNDVETMARFYAPKYIACYSDTLRCALSATGRAEIIPKIVDLGPFLEFGASSKTQLSLMALGFSRTASIELSQRMPSLDMEEANCIAYLNSEEWHKGQLPELIIREILAFLEMRNN